MSFGVGEAGTGCAVALSGVVFMNTDTFQPMPDEVRVRKDITNSADYTEIDKGSGSDIASTVLLPLKKVKSMTFITWATVVIAER